jgi:RNA polymerase sigma-70 factor (ECF subfamily)
MSDFESVANLPLIEKAKSDPAAFATLYRQFRDPVFYYIYTRVGNRKDAEDLIEQTFLNVLEDLNGYRDEGHFTAWIFTIARSRVADFYRRRKPSVSIEQIFTLCDPLQDPVEHMIRSETMQSLGTLLNLLEENERELLRLRFSARLSFKDIACILKRKESAIKMSYYRLIERLQSQWERTNDRA